MDKKKQSQGIVSSIQYKKGFGFIAFEDKEIFFHKKNTLGNFQQYTEDDIVHFTLISSKQEKDKGKLEAIKVINEANLKSRERYLNSLKKGEIIEARIRYKTINGYHVGLKHSTDGFLSFENISYVKSEDSESLFEKGDAVFLKVTKVDVKKKLVYLNYKNIILPEFWQNGDAAAVEVGTVLNCNIRRKIMTQYGYSRLMLENDNILNYEFSLRRKLGILYDDLDRDEVYHFLANIDPLFRTDSKIMVRVQELDPSINKVVFSWWIENDFELERAEQILFIAYQTKVSQELKNQVYMNMLDITSPEYADDVIAYKAKMEAQFPSAQTNIFAADNDNDNDNEEEEE